MLRPTCSRASSSRDAVSNVVHVPREAVIRGGTSSRVVVDLGDGRFESQPVLIGIESGDRVAIRRASKRATSRRFGAVPDRLGVEYRVGARTHGGGAMIARLIRWSIANRFLVVITRCWSRRGACTP